MIVHPGVIALIFGSLLVTGFAAYAAGIGLKILRHWDLQSGSERQIALERKTYLVSTIVAHLLAFQMFSLFLFVYTAEDIHPLFVGAMCAAGTLNVNEFGYPTLMLKFVTVFLCGVWMILNHTDHEGFDYPLIKTKYRFLILIALLLILELCWQTVFFTRLEADVITSCCGTLFSEQTPTIGGNVAALPSYPTTVLFFVTVALTLRTGIHVLVTGNGVRVFSGFAVGLLVLSILSVISFISVYYYELPTHHCPFCILQKDYDYVGYALYASLLGAGIAGAGAGFIDRFRRVSSLADAIPRIQKRLCLFSVSGYTVLAAIAAYPMIFSDFKLGGY